VDADGNVVGSYTILGADGRPLVVRYRAGKDIGYVVENLQEVIARTTPAQAGQGSPEAPAVLAVGLDDDYESEPPAFPAISVTRTPAIVAPPAASFSRVPTSQAAAAGKRVTSASSLTSPSTSRRRLSFGTRNIPVANSFTATAHSGSSATGSSVTQTARQRQQQPQQQANVRLSTRPAQSFPNFAQVCIHFSVFLLKVIYPIASKIIINLISSFFVM